MKELKLSTTGPSDSFRWRDVSSSFIGAVKHEKGRVKISISGRAYAYVDSTGRKYKGIMQANSKGKYFNRNIKYTKSGSQSRFRKGSR